MSATSNQSELLDPGLADWLDPLATARAIHWCMARLRLKDNSACIEEAQVFLSEKHSWTVVDCVKAKLDASRDFIDAQRNVWPQSTEGGLAAEYQLFQVVPGGGL